MDFSFHPLSLWPEPRAPVGFQRPVTVVGGTAEVTVNPFTSVPGIKRDTAALVRRLFKPFFTAGALIYTSG